MFFLVYNPEYPDLNEQVEILSPSSICSCLSIQVLSPEFIQTANVNRRSIKLGIRASSHRASPSLYQHLSQHPEVAMESTLEEMRDGMIVNQKF